MNQQSSTHHEMFQILIGDAELNYRPIEIPDPIVTGRQILDTAGARPADEHCAIAILSDGALESLRQDERFDLRGRGAEKVLIFKTAEILRFILDGRDCEWGSKYISGRVLKILAGVDTSTHDVYQEMRKSEDLLIRDEDQVDISKSGLEKFFTAIAQTTEGLTTFLPPKDITYLEGRGIAYEEVTESGQTGVILKAITLPEGKFSANHVDVLIMLPPSYPDCPPDMFYCLPWLKLQPNGNDPRAASVQYIFNCKVWQRWSRHNNEWRPGIDGLQTMLKRIELALTQAG